MLLPGSARDRMNISHKSAAAVGDKAQELQILVLVRVLVLVKLI